MKNRILYPLGFLILLIIQSCSVVGLIQSHKKVTGDFISSLNPVDSDATYDMSINVIQGIAAFENGWFTSQTSASKYLLINYLDNQGESLFNIKLTVNSHAQDLSLEQISENKLYLYTSVGHYNKKAASGMLRLKVILPEKVNGTRDMSKLSISVDRIFDLHLDNATPTISEDKNSFAIRSANTVLIYTKDALLNGKLNPSTSFELNSIQLKEANQNLWFQGIAMKDNKVYCLTGNNSIDSPKYLFVYNLKGEVLKKYTIDKNEFAKSIGHKYEPEGLTFVGNDLYYLIMAKANTGGNLKYLYKLNQ